jgi:hexokinase
MDIWTKPCVFLSKTKAEYKMETTEMGNINSKAGDFLKRHRMHPDQVDMDECCRIFLEDMESGLTGHPSSLEMIPTYIETEKEVSTDKPVVVIDAGGTNFRVAVVHFNKDKQAVIENRLLYDMPGIDKEVSKERFFEIMAGYVSDVVGKSPNIGFCFSYPAQIQPNRDGRLIRFSKEIKAPEVQGQLIGENLNAALAAIGVEEPKHIVILNDTVTTLLAGRAASLGPLPRRASGDAGAGKNYDSYVGFILGTGTNCAYIESNKNITKKPDLDPTKSQIINIESGGFGKAPLGSIDIEFDKSTKNPGEHTFEKMISGAYLGPLSLLTIRKAVKENLFNAVTGKKLSGIHELSTKDISDFLNQQKEPANSLAIAVAREDIDLMVELLEKIVERAAKLTAINLSSAALKSGKGRDPNRPVCIVAEGTTFYKLHNLKSQVEHYLKQYLEGQRGIHYEIISVENATLIGAAIAGLTN